MKTTIEQLIPRKKNFADLEKKDVQISASGKYVSYITGVNGNLTIWAVDLCGTENAEPLCTITEMGFSGYNWMHTDDHCICTCAKYIGSYSELIKVDVVQKTATKLSFGDIRLRTLPGRFTSTGKIPVMGYRGSNEIGDLYILNSSENRLDLLYSNKEQFDWFICDNDLNLRYSARYNENGICEYYVFNSSGTWEKSTLSNVDLWQIVGCFNGRDSIYISDMSVESCNSLYEINLKTGHQTLIASHPEADFDGHVIIDPKNGNILAAGIFYTQMIWSTSDNDIKNEFEWLKLLHKGNLNILCTTSANDIWLVEFTSKNTLPDYYLYDRRIKKIRFLFTGIPDKENVQPCPMNWSFLQSRDNLKLLSYYTLPSGNSKTSYQPLPTVMLVHSGPWERDFWGYNPMHQWLANRGYAVICVNFRGSAGFGSSFMDAGIGEWGRAMQFDLVDTINHYIALGISDPHRIGIMGTSYGGYASLMAIALNPKLFSCAVAFGAPLNLVTLLDSIPAFATRLKGISYQHIGETNSAEGRKRLLERSPLYKVEEIHKPLLIGYGDNDTQISSDEYMQFVTSLRKKDIPVTQVRFKDEGHGIQNNSNKCSFLAITELFLAHHLDGVAEEIGDNLENSTTSILYGEHYIPDLKEVYDQFTIENLEKFVCDLE